MFCSPLRRGAPVRRVALASRSKIMLAFIEYMRGYRIKAMIQEFWDEVPPQAILNGPYPVVKDYAPYFEGRGELPPPLGQRPFLGSLTREDILGNYGPHRRSRFRLHATAPRLHARGTADAAPSRFRLHRCRTRAASPTRAAHHQEPLAHSLRSLRPHRSGIGARDGLSVQPGRSWSGEAKAFSQLCPPASRRVASGLWRTRSDGKESAAGSNH